MTNPSEKSPSVRTWLTRVWEAGKWLLVIYLFLPLAGVAEGALRFERVMLGVLLFLLFAGTKLYDLLITRSRDETREWITILGTMAALMVFLVLIGFLFVTVLSEMVKTDNG